MNGTEWTEPGQGAKVKELLSAARESANGNWTGACADLRQRFVNASAVRTNLRLTGAPQS